VTLSKHTGSLTLRSRVTHAKERRLPEWAQVQRVKSWPFEKKVSVTLET
jgi:hypothetical protein